MSKKKTSLRKFLEDFNKKRYDQLFEKKPNVMLKNELFKVNRLVMKEATDKEMFKYLRERRNPTKK